MNKKLILTETQYDNLTMFIVESRFDKFVKNVAKVGDTIKIDFKNSTNTFKVIRNDMGQIQMDNTDAGSTNINYRYFMTISSLHDNSLTIKRAHKVKVKDKLNDVKVWKPIEVRGIRDIQLIRNGEVIDTVDKPTGPNQKPTSKNEANFPNEAENNLGIILNELNEGKGIVLNMLNKEELMFCCMGRTNGSFTLELRSKTTLTALQKWDSFVLKINGTPDETKTNDTDESLYKLNSDIIKTSDAGHSFNLLVQGNSGSDVKKLWINGILGITVTPNCESKSEEKSDKSTENIDRLRAAGKKAMNAILNDPTLKDAFYKQPTLWNLFLADLKGKEATGTGIVPTLDIVKKYFRKKKSETLDAEFNEGKTVVVKPLESVTVPYVKDGKNLSFTFQALSDELYQTYVGDEELGSNTVLYSKNKKENVRYSIELLKRMTKVDDSFLCNITVAVKEGSKLNKFVKDDVVFKVIRQQSPGYKPLIEPTQKEKK